MRQLSASEVLNLTKLLQMEITGLAVARAGLNVISDDQLRVTSQQGIVATESRIAGLQQFINENRIDTQEEVQ